MHNETDCLLDGHLIRYVEIKQVINSTRRIVQLFHGSLIWMNHETLDISQQTNRSINQLIDRSITDQSLHRATIHSY